MRALWMWLRAMYGRLAEWFDAHDHRMRAPFPDEEKDGDTDENRPYPL